MSLASDLRTQLKSDAVIIDDPEILVAYQRDQAPFAKSGEPELVLIAKSTEDISQTLKFAFERKIPVVVRGAGSGLAGGANSIVGCIVISTEKMNQILSLDPVNHIAVVEAGVINKDLDIAASTFGLAYYPDPASREWSTIGGNIATNAGGMCCVKYGVTSQHVRAIKVVLADGEVVNLGFPTKKAVTTLDLMRLFIGSEGTLGVIVEATVAIPPRQKDPTTLIATFSKISDATNSAKEMLNLRPSMLEIMDYTTLQAIEAWKPMGFSDCKAVLIMQSDSSPEDCKLASEIARKNGAIDSEYSEDPKDSADLIQVRKLAYPALERMGVALLDDVVVPISEISTLVEGVTKIAEKSKLTIGIFGHAGDGNMHPTIVYPHNDAEAELRAVAAFNEIIALAQSLGGTASGEHGIGNLKVNQSAEELPARVRELQQSIKKTFDPQGILNPGKKFSI
jgi:glycolate oxidase